MDATIKAIPSYYKNTLMRSRIECRWAFIFDKLHLNYQYEEQGFDLGNGIWYLPDFTIRTTETFYVEVKGIQPTQLEVNKATLLAMGLRTNVVIVWSGIPAKLSQLSTMSINKTGKIVLRNPLVDAFMTVDKEKRLRILGLARSYKF